jgi:hypothetical protein
MAKQFFVVLSLLTLMSVFGADGSHLDAIYRTAILEGGRFKEVRSARDLPREIRIRCFNNLEVADPNEHWNSTDAVSDPNAPFSHLAWAVTDGELWLVEWELGGLAYAWGITLFREKPGSSAEYIWGTKPGEPFSESPMKRVFPTRLKSFEEFRQHLRTGDNR